MWPAAAPPPRDLPHLQAAAAIDVSVLQADLAAGQRLVEAGRQLQQLDGSYATACSRHAALREERYRCERHTSAALLPSTGGTGAALMPSTGGTGAALLPSTGGTGAALLPSTSTANTAPCPAQAAPTLPCVPAACSRLAAALEGLSKQVGLAYAALTGGAGDAYLSYTLEQQLLFAEGCVALAPCTGLWLGGQRGTGGPPPPCRVPSIGGERKGGGVPPCRVPSIGGEREGGVPPLPGALHRRREGRGREGGGGPGETGGVCLHQATGPA